MLKRLLPVVLVGLAACAEAPPEPGSVAPAGQEARAEFGSGPGDAYKAKADAPVKELFCVNALGGGCPADIDEQLAPFDVDGTGSRIDLVDSFVQLKAARSAGDAGAEISDEAYVEAAYAVILGRASDPGGFSANLSFVAQTGGRRTLVESMLRSAEFRN